MAKADLPVQKNEIIEATFEDLSHEGAGVAKVNGYTLFVRGVLPGERAQIKVVHTKKNYGFAKLLALRITDPQRVTPPCPIYDKCGGCQMQHLSYDGQLAHKRQVVEEAMTRIGGLNEVSVRPTLGMADPWRYRNKIQVPVGERDGDLIVGFYQRGSHRIVDMDACIIQDHANDDAVQTIKEIVSAYGVEAYDETTRQGTLRHIIVRNGQQSGEMMVVLVTRTKHLPNRKNIVRDITQALPHVKSIMHNVNPKPTNVIFGDETRVLWGRDVIYDTIGKVKFAISARSFYQVNPQQTKVLYDKALEFANLTGAETVVDAYCGIGTISLFLAGQAKQVYGAEVVPEAIEDARRNAELNGLENVTFEVGEAEEVIPAWQKQGVQADVIVVDPPRKGCDEELLQTMINMRPKRVVYVSCNPATLARDLRILEDGGFRTEEAQPVDMFPQTMHVECVTYLTMT